MRAVRDTVWMAWLALAVRPLRTLLMALGAAVGVAVLVGSQAVLLSAKGHVRSALSALGTNLVVVDVGDGSESLLPASAVGRIGSIEGVESTAASAIVVNAPAVSDRVLGTGLAQVSTPIWTSAGDLLAVIGGELMQGRWLTSADELARLPAAVLGAQSSKSLLPGPLQPTSTIWIGDVLFAVVGTLDPVALAPEVDSAIFIPSSIAAQEFGQSPGATRLYVRLRDDLVRDAATWLPLATTLGDGPPPTMHVASKLLEAQAAVDAGLSETLFAVGLLAAAIGAFGVFNTLSISLLERRKEIGLRRAIGHPKFSIGGQFLAESVIVGLLGAVVGEAGGLSFAGALSAHRGWRFTIDAATLWMAAGGAVLLCSLAGTLVAFRAARVEPLSAMRNDAG